MGGEFSIGSLRIASPFTLAALSGYSDMGMRYTCQMLGASFTRNEVVLDQVVLQGCKGARGGRHIHAEEQLVCCQLMGADPVQMAAAAPKLLSHGYQMVDLNFGCPVKKVLGRCRGGYLLGEPATALEMVRLVRAAVPPTVPVTIKMRRGTDDSPAATSNFWQILTGAVELGIAAVVIHGRTVAQKYEGLADWSIIRQAKQRFPDLAVLGSGDLFTAADCLRMLHETGCDGVTIARGAIENPWIFRECLALWNGAPLPPPPTIAEQAELFDRQYQLCIEQYGVETASRQMRKFGIKRAHLHPRADELRQAFIKLSKPADWHAVRDQYYTGAALEWEQEVRRPDAAETQPADRLLACSCD